LCFVSEKCHVNILNYKSCKIYGPNFFMVT